MVLIQQRWTNLMNMTRQAKETLMFPFTDTATLAFLSMPLQWRH